MFLSATVVHFASILAACLITLAPIASFALLGVLIGGSGLAALIYCGVAWREVVRDGVARRIDLEDRIWYAALPAV